MIDVIAHRGEAANSSWPGEDGAARDVYKTWTAEQAAAWRLTQPRVSAWHVLAAQFLAGVVCGVVAWLLTRRFEVVCSALYGALVVVVPGALLARGMTRGARNAVAAAAGFLFWEMLKIGVAVAMLAIATRVVPNLSWPAMLVTMVVCIKVNWLALLWRGRRMNNRAGQRDGS